MTAYHSLQRMVRSLIVIQHDLVKFNLCRWKVRPYLIRRWAYGGVRCQEIAGSKAFSVTREAKSSSIQMVNLRKPFSQQIRLFRGFIAQREGMSIVTKKVI